MFPFDDVIIDDVKLGSMKPIRVYFFILLRQHSLKHLCGCIIVTQGNYFMLRKSVPCFVHFMYTYFLFGILAFKDYFLDLWRKNWHRWIIWWRAYFAERHTSFQRFHEVTIVWHGVTVVGYIVLWIGGDIVNLDKICLVLCKTMLYLWYRYISKVNTTDFQPWAQYWQNIYAALRCTKILKRNLAAPQRTDIWPQ